MTHNTQIYYNRAVHSNHLESGTSFGFVINLYCTNFSVKIFTVDVMKVPIICYKQIHWILKKWLKLDMNYAWFQASAAKSMRTALLCVITQWIVVISYQSFGTTYRSHLYLTGQCDYSTQRNWCCLLITDAFYTLHLINS